MLCPIIVLLKLFFFVVAFQTRPETFQELFQELWSVAKGKATSLGLDQISCCNCWLLHLLLKPRNWVPLTK